MKSFMITRDDVGNVRYIDTSTIDGKVLLLNKMPVCKAVNKVFNDLSEKFNSPEDRQHLSGWIEVKLFDNDKVPYMCYVNHRGQEISLIRGEKEFESLLNLDITSNLGSTTHSGRTAHSGSTAPSNLQQAKQHKSSFVPKAIQGKSIQGMYKAFSDYPEWKKTLIVGMAGAAVTTFISATIVMAIPFVVLAIPFTILAASYYGVRQVGEFAAKMTAKITEFCYKVAVEIVKNISKNAKWTLQMVMDGTLYTAKHIKDGAVYTKDKVKDGAAYTKDKAEIFAQNKMGSLADSLGKVRDTSSLLREDIKAKSDDIIKQFKLIENGGDRKYNNDLCKKILKTLKKTIELKLSHLADNNQERKDLTDQLRQLIYSPKRLQLLTQPDRSISRAGPALRNIFYEYHDEISDIIAECKKDPKLHNKRSASQGTTSSPYEESSSRNSSDSSSIGSNDTATTTDSTTPLIQVRPLPRFISQPKNTSHSSTSSNTFALKQEPELHHSSSPEDSGIEMNNAPPFRLRKSSDASFISAQNYGWNSYQGRPLRAASPSSLHENEQSLENEQSVNAKPQENFKNYYEYLESLNQQTEDLNRNQPPSSKVSDLAAAEEARQYVASFGRS